MKDNGGERGNGGQWRSEISMGRRKRLARIIGTLENQRCEEWGKESEWAGGPCANEVLAPPPAAWLPE